jgi:DNA-binding response OmpR family regulator
LVDGKRVLVVDDDTSIRELLHSALVEEGYDVMLAVDGRDALSVMERWIPDVIVLDLMMPLMDGWAFAKEVRDRYDVPIIAVSAVTELPRHATALGVSDFLTKPFDLDALLPKISRAAGVA